MVMNRDIWMPLACSINEEYAGRHIQNAEDIKAPYMILSFDTTENIDEIKAGTHPYDNTVRPHVISKSHNPEYHRLIAEFEKRSGIGAILNSSFNLHGFPNVHTPTDAHEVFRKSGLQFIAIEDHFVWKQ
jgi:carbamoyltransferase